jgi:hypothetical protein
MLFYADRYCGCFSVPFRALPLESENDCLIPGFQALGPSVENGGPWLAGGIDKLTGEVKAGRSHLS